jgi:hypothetical protein
MKPTARLLVCLLAATLLPSATHAQAKSDAADAQQLSMQFQGTDPASPSEFQLHFCGYHDARCPSDVRCGVAGEATALFWLVGAHIKPQVLSLPWTGGAQDWRHAVRVGNREFVLRSLEPRPMQSRAVSPSEYTAVVEVRLRRANKPLAAR